MFEFIKVENVYDSNFEEVYDLYTSSFPNYARRTWQGLETVFNKKNAFHCNCIKLDGKTVGFINYWIFDKFTYIEHFAIHPDFRDNGLGSQVLKNFISNSTLPIILETETPRTITASKRIHFYERLNFYMISNFYMQPPYEGGQVMMSMLIMCNDYHFATKNFSQIKTTLYKEVYKFDQKKTR